MILSIGKFIQNQILGDLMIQQENQRKNLQKS